MFQRLNLEATTFSRKKEKEKKKRKIKYSLQVQVQEIQPLTPELNTFSLVASVPASVSLFQMMNRMTGPSTTFC